MKNKKILIIGIIFVIICITITTFVIIKKLSNNADTIKEMVYDIPESDYQFFILCVNEKYGVIGTNGNIIIEPQYDKVIIPNPQKPVFICSNNENEKNVIFNDKKEEIFTIYDNVEPIEINGVVTSLPYEKYILKYKVNDNYGLVDINGERITKAIYSEIKGLKYKEGELLAKKDEKYGVIDTKGRVQIKFEYDDIEGDKYYNKENGYSESGYIVKTTTEEGYRYGYITNDNKKLTDTVYNDIKRIIEINGEDIYLIASFNGQYGLLKNSDVIIDFKYQGIEYNDLNNLLIINRSTKYGVYTLEGNEVIPIEYKTLQFNGIYVYAKNGDDVKYFKKDGQEVTSEFTYLQPVQDGKYYISTNKEGLYGLTNNNQEVIINNEYVYFDYLFAEYFVAYKKEQGLGIINANGNIEKEFKYTTINKIGDTNLIKVEDMKNEVVEIYSSNLQVIARLENAELDIRDTYMRLYNDNTNIYINFNGTIIGEDEALANTKEAPDNIGEYEKDYFGYSEIYYKEKTEE